MVIELFIRFDWIINIKLSFILLIHLSDLFKILCIISGSIMFDLFTFRIQIILIYFSLQSQLFSYDRIV